MSKWVGAREMDESTFAIVDSLEKVVRTSNEVDLTKTELTRNTFHTQIDSSPNLLCIPSKKEQGHSKIPQIQ